MSTESNERERFLCVEIPRRPKRSQATTTTTTTAAAAASSTPTHAKTSSTHTSPRPRRRSSGTTRASAALIARLPTNLKEKLYRHETIEILEAVTIPPYIKQKERIQNTRHTHQKPQASSSRPTSKGSTHSTSYYGSTPSRSPSLPSKSTQRRTIIMDSDEESDPEYQGGEDYEEGEMSMSSLVRRTKLSRNTKVAQKIPIQTESPSKGKSKTSSSGSNYRKKNEKLRKRLMEEVELDEDAGIALLPAKRTRNQSNSSFRQNLQRLRSKGFANRGEETSSSSESSDGSDSSGDDSDIPDSQGNIASFVIQDNEEEAEKVLAQIPEKFRRDQDQTPKNDFKLYIEYLFWLVYDKHALDNQESRYDAPVQRIMKILSTYQSTLSSSGVWSPNFLSLVDQRPKLRKVGLVDEEETFCAACKNTSHKAQFAVTLFGAQYEVPMKPSELDRFSTMFSPSTGTQRIDSNSDGQEFRFKLGSICTRRSMLYHKARHFSYQCVWKIIDHCTRKQKNQPGQTSAQKLAQRLAHKQTKSNDTDRVDAASLVTTLQGVTSKLWLELDDLKLDVAKLHSGSK